MFASVLNYNKEVNLVVMKQTRPCPWHNVENWIHLFLNQKKCKMLSADLLADINQKYFHGFGGVDFLGAWKSHTENPTRCLGWNRLQT